MLYQCGIVLHHLIVLLTNVEVLYPRTTVVDSATSNVTTSSLQSMGFVLHYSVVLFVISGSKVFQRWDESCSFDPAHHVIENRGDSSKQLYSL
jgi:hypothetical protein